MSRPGRYTERVSAIGQAGVELLKAEASVLAGEMRLTTRAVVRILVLTALAAFVLFWALAVIVFLGIEVGSLWLPRWGASLVVLALLLVLALVAALAARRTLRRVESPAALVRRRLDDHRDWWHNRLARRPARPGDRRAGTRAEEPSRRD